MNTLKKADDIIGKTFHFYTVLRRTEGRTSYYDCQCRCGALREVKGVPLKTGRAKSCGCMKSPDLSGQNFGKLTAIRRAHQIDGFKWVYLCRCDCGREKCILGSQLLRGKAKSCGCKAEPEDLTRRQFGRLLVLERSGTDAYGKALYICRCECGNAKTASAANLHQGHTTHCGCQRRRVAKSPALGTVPEPVAAPKPTPLATPGLRVLPPVDYHALGRGIRGSGSPWADVVALCGTEIAAELKAEVLAKIEQKKKMAATQ